MKKLKRVFGVFWGITLLTAFVACDKDKDDENNGNEGNAQGSYSLSVTGGDAGSISGEATYEFDNDLVRIKFGDNPPDIVMNYSLKTDEDIIPVGIYDPVSATGTGMPDNSIAVQYNGDETYFGESGTVEITSSGNGEISGSLNILLESIGGNTMTVEGDFTALQ